METMTNEQILINNKIVDEMDDINGWIVNADGRFWICGDVPGGLHRRLDGDEVDAIYNNLILTGKRKGLEFTEVV